MNHIHGRTSAKFLAEKVFKFYYSLFLKIKFPLDEIIALTYSDARLH